MASPARDWRQREGSREDRESGIEAGSDRARRPVGRRGENERADEKRRPKAKPGAGRMARWLKPRPHWACAQSGVR